MAISTDTVVRVAHADIALGMAFSNSIGHWHHGNGEPVLIEGDCTEDLSVPNHGLLHIAGNLSSQITAAGHYEIVVAGDVTETGSIVGSGFCHVFVGGSFAGKLAATDSTKLWVDADLTGSVGTGMPSTLIHVGRDFRGEISPTGSLSLLYLIVRGFASNKRISHIADLGYTQFNASIGTSDDSVGLHPVTGHRQRTANGNSFSRWSIAEESAG